MYTVPAKKMLIMNILDILKRYSDEDHRLSQRDIEDILEREYCVKAERKSIKRNLMNLLELGYDVEYSESIRKFKNPKTGKTEELYTYTDFYLKRDFTDAELRFLIDGILFSQNIPGSQRSELISKLESLSNVYFTSRIKHIATARDNSHFNRQLFYTVDMLDEAISRSRQVSFTYLEYGTDKKLHKKKRPDSSVREYVINPYQMVIRDGKYYLICNYDKYNDISNYRVDRISDIKILDTPAKSFNTLDGAERRGLDLQKYMADHIYMYSGKNIRVDFTIPQAMISDVIDTFGTDVSFFDESENEISASVIVNDEAMLHFAKKYAPDVTVLSPKSLAERVAGDMEKALEKYKKEK